MKVKYISILFILFSINHLKIFSQDTLHKYNIGINAGLISYIINDKLLNDYNYSGNSSLPFHLNCYYLGENNIHFLNYYYKASVLNPNANMTLYNYNYLQLWDNSFKYEYFRKIKYFSNNRFKLFIGGGYGIYSLVEHENYSSLLITKSNDFKYSFDISAMDLYFLILLKYSINKNTFFIKSGNSIVGLNSRPDDFYVKFGGDNLAFKFYTLRDYESFQFSFLYQHDLFKHLALRLEYESQFNKYYSGTAIKLFKQMFLYGFSVKI